MVVVLAAQSPASVALEDPEDLRRFHVRVEGTTDEAAIAGAFAATGAGRFENLDRAFVSVEKVRELAAGRVPADWEAGFEGMLGYAAGKGWYDAAAGTIQAHCEVAQG